MNIKLSEFTGTNVYHLMTQTIIPRPIAWVLSYNSDQSYNLAPFSYFNAVCSEPPLFVLSIGKNSDGGTKDTTVNLQVGAHCVVHIAHVEQANEITATAASLAYGKSELDAANIDLVEHTSWPMKRIKECKIAYLCKVHSTQEIGDAPQQLIFLEGIELHIDDKAISKHNGRLIVDALYVNPLARLGANQYANLGDTFTKTRPK